MRFNENYHDEIADRAMVVCLCGSPVQIHAGRGRSGKYCSDRCRQRAKRSRDRGGESVTKFRETVTKIRDKQPLEEIRPILKYPGAKWRVASKIIPLFPPHLRYVEPYFGSGACFFLKEPSRHEVINDLNESVVNLFKIIRDRGVELARAIEMTPWAEDEYGHVERNYTDEDELEHARKFLIRCWQAHGGTLFQVAGWKHNGINGHAYPVRLWRQLPSRLLAVVDRLRDAEIRNRPALEIIEYYNSPDTLLYVDPPYVLSTRGRKYYPYEMTDADHVALLDVLNKHQGMIVLSGYAHPIYDEQLKHWQRVTFSSVAEHGKQRTEVLWLNPHIAGNRQLSLGFDFYHDEIVR